MTPKAAESPVEDLLEFLKRNRGFDFTGYKRSTLERRIAKRMGEVDIESHAEYMDFLEVHPEEFSVLFNTILINVTAFFRDLDAWEHLRDEALPALLDQRPKDAAIRVWSAGCASGEEAYSAAIVLCELLGEDAYKSRVKIYATDVDEEALDQARTATYSAKQVEGVPDALRARYFERNDQRYLFRSDLRRTVVFGRNDLEQDAPISRVDLLLCRNALMYFNAETQSQILRRFHFALLNDSILFLGKSEMLITHSELFEPLDLRRRMFRRVPQSQLQDRLRVLAHTGDDNFSGNGALQMQAFDRSTGAQIVVDVDGSLVAANAEARGMFTLTDADIGRPVQDLELSYRPVELRSHIDHVVRDRQPVRLSDVHATGQNGDDRVYEIRLAPLINRDDELLGTAVAFLDVTTHHQLQNELTRSKRELEDAYEELQSTVEELETTNEELQSTNEELETMNDELRLRSLELDEVNAFLETILTSMGLAVTVIDRQGVIQVWNTHAQDLWGLRGDEVEGQHFLGLDIGLPVEKLKAPIRQAANGKQPRAEIVLDATNRRGRAISCRVTLLPLGPEKDPTGVILLMSELPPDAKS